MYFNIIKAMYIENYKIELTFSNNKKGVVDFENYLKNGEVFQSIMDIDKFRNFKIDYGTLTWDNGRIDIAPETLYIKATGDSINFNDQTVKKIS
jgi:hypothetical protein